MGLKQAIGKYVWFVDGDDWIAESAIFKLCDATGRYRCDMVIFGIDYLNENLIVIGGEDRLTITGRSKDETPQNYIIKASIIQDHRLRFSDSVSMGEDLEFQYKCLMLCSMPISIEGRLYCYLRRSGSATNNERTRANAAYSSAVIMEHLVDFIIDNKVEEKEWLSARMNRVFKNVLSSNAYIIRYDHDIQRRIICAFIKLKRFGHHDFIDHAVRIGKLNMRFYGTYIKLRRFIKH